MGKRARQRDEAVARAAAATIANAPRRGGTERQVMTTPGKPPAGPPALWHPIPVTELALVTGGIVLMVGTIQGASGSVAIGAGLLLITLSSLELCAREHFCGYRPHVLFLSMMPTVALQTLVLLLFGRRISPTLQVAGGVVVFLALVFVMRWSFKRARPKWLARRRGAARP